MSLTQFGVNLSKGQFLISIHDMHYCTYGMVTTALQNLGWQSLILYFRQYQHSPSLCGLRRRHSTTMVKKKESSLDFFRSSLSLFEGHFAQVIPPTLLHIWTRPWIPWADNGCHHNEQNFKKWIGRIVKKL